MNRDWAHLIVLVNHMVRACNAYHDPTGCFELLQDLFAVPTNLKYFPNTPRVYLGAGAFHTALRVAISASSTFN